MRGLETISRAGSGVAAGVGVGVEGLDPALLPLALAPPGPRPGTRGYRIAGLVL